MTAQSRGDATNPCVQAGGGACVASGFSRHQSAARATPATHVGRGENIQGVAIIQQHTLLKKKRSDHSKRKKEIMNSISIFR